MPFENGFRGSTHTNNDLNIDFLANNPFANDPGILYTSALAARPVFKRHGSEGAPRRDIWFASHSRAQTEDQFSSVWYHPLKSSENELADDAGITRPHLTRALEALDSATTSQEGERAEGSEGEDGKTKAGEDTEKTVLVHVVTSKDSLAAVALKYGISMAELRRANHLWASDSIHLRNILYIPLDKTPHAKRFAVKNLDDNAASSSPSLHPDEHLSLSSETIRRIPASQLSFFPPPSKPTPSRSLPRAVPTSRLDVPPRPLPSPSSRTLSSILTALPISAAARDTIVARLSFDSSRSSTSDEQQHELADVRAHTSSVANATPKARYRGTRTTITNRGVFSSSPPSPSLLRTSSLSSHPSSIREGSAIRTSQMEPSPGMQLPSRSLATKSVRS